MSFGAFVREQKEGMSTPSFALLQKQLLAGETVIAPLVDTSCKQGSVRLTE